MKNESVLAYDLGTSGVKIVAVGFDGELIGVETEYYSLYSPQKGYAEQDPHEIWEAVCRGTRKLVSTYDIDIEGIRGMAFGTQWKAIIPVDRDGNVLHNAIIWMDTRAQVQADALNRKMNTSEFSNRDYHARLMWFRENRQHLYEKTCLFLELNSYLKYRLCGNVASDLSNNFIESNDPGLNVHYQNILENSGLDREKFPPLVMPEEKVGEVHEEAAAAMGIRAGVEVFAGFGDIPAVAVGTGASKTDEAHFYLGSSGWLAVSVQERKEGIGELYQSFYKGQELLLYVLQSACMTLNWAVDLFYSHEKKVLGNKVFERIDSDIKTILDERSFVVATPWLNGELPPLSSHARACFINLSAFHDRRHMVRAVRESIGFSLRTKMMNYHEQTGKTIESIRIAGGATESAVWMQTLSNILNIPVVIPANARHAGAVGVACCALVGLGIYKDFAEAQEGVKVDRVFDPQKRFEAHYGKLFSAYETIYPSLQETFRLLGKQE